MDNRHSFIFLVNSVRNILGTYLNYTISRELYNYLVYGLFLTCRIPIKRYIYIYMYVSHIDIYMYVEEYEWAKTLHVVQILRTRQKRRQSHDHWWYNTLIYSSSRSIQCTIISNLLWTEKKGFLFFFNGEQANGNIRLYKSLSSSFFLFYLLC